MIIHVEVSAWELYRLPSRSYRLELLKLLQTRGMVARSFQDFDGKIENWEDPSDHFVHYKQTIFNEDI
jgi:hypothetical protein